MSKRAAVRPLGQITGDLEPLLFELVCNHELQFGEVLALVHSWLQIHAPQAQEIYNDGSGSPIYSYSPQKLLKIRKQK